MILVYIGVGFFSWKTFFLGMEVRRTEDFPWLLSCISGHSFLQMFMNVTPFSTITPTLCPPNSLVYEKLMGQWDSQLQLSGSPFSRNSDPTHDASGLMTPWVAGLEQGTLATVSELPETSFCCSWNIVSTHAAS